MEKTGRKDYMMALFIGLTITSLLMINQVKATSETILSQYTTVEPSNPHCESVIANHPDLSDLSAMADNFSTSGIWEVTTISFYLSRFEENVSDYDQYIAARFYEPDPLDVTLPDETQIVGDSIAIRVDSLPESAGNTVAEWINFTFAIPVSLETAHEYFFAVYGVNGTWDGGGSLAVTVYGNDTEPLEGFNSGFNSYNGGEWVYDSPNFNLGYIIYGIETEPEAPEPEAPEPVTTTELDQILPMFAILVMLCIFGSIIRINKTPLGQQMFKAIIVVIFAIAVLVTLQLLI